MGAIAEVADQIEVVANDVVVNRLHIPDADLDTVYQRELAELRRRTALYRGDRVAARIAGRVVIVVDDGLATGSTMRAAVGSRAPSGSGPADRRRAGGSARHLPGAARRGRRGRVRADP